MTMRERFWKGTLTRHLWRHC